MTRNDWMALPYLVRMWRALFCDHPFDSSVPIEKIHLPDYGEQDGEFSYVVNVRECGKCRTHFIDEGYELTCYTSAHTGNGDSR